MAGNTQELRGHDAPDAQGDLARGGLIRGGQDAAADKSKNDDQAMAQNAGMRAEAMQRVQIGVAGLAAMALLVGLANIIMTSAQQNQAQVVPVAAPTVVAREPTERVNDPLADMGVLPDGSSEPKPAEQAQPAGAASGDAPALTP